SVIARREARVRNQQHGRAVCGQRPLGEKKTFFGYFLASTKKLPAGRRTAEALDLINQTTKSKVAGFPLSREWRSRAKRVHGTVGARFIAPVPARCGRDESRPYESELPLGNDERRSGAPPSPQPSPASG